MIPIKSAKNLIGYQVSFLRNVLPLNLFSSTIKSDRSGKVSFQYDEDGFVQVIIHILFKVTYLYQNSIK